MKKGLSILLCAAMLLGILPASAGASGSSNVVWDMENLPEEDLVTAGWAYANYEGVESGGVMLYPSQDVKIRRAEGKGNGGSTALEIYQVNAGDWSDIFTLTLTADSTADADWTGAKMLWFWVSNTTGKDTRLELLINGKTPGTTYHYYSYAGGKLTDLGTLPLAWGTADYARPVIKNGFEGYIGLPLSAFGRIGQVSSLRIYVPDLAVGKSLYLDDFCITEQFLFYTAGGGDALDSTTVLNPTDTEGAYQITTDFGAEHQQIVALGASDCWWATGIGDTGTASAVLKLLFTDLGIGLNNYRINVGGGVKEDKSDTIGGWRGPESPLGEDGTLDITRNKNSWAALTEVAQLGTISDYTLFMNTPPSTMMDNGLTYQGKLKEDCYTAYAEYVADVVKLYLDAGIDVKYVSPVNEPTGAGWVTATGQECAVYTMEQIVDVYVEVIKALKAKNLDVKLSIADFNRWSVADENLTLVLDGVLKNEQIADYALDYVDHISGHSYGTNTANRKSMAAAMAAYNEANGTDIVLHQTEWAPMVGEIGDNMETATELAYTLHEDLTILDVDTWSWWLGASYYTYTDGLIYTSQEGKDIAVTKRMWAYGNYSKFIKGMTRIETGGTLPDGVYVSAYKDDAAGKLVYVLINRNEEGQPVKLANLPQAQAQVWETSDSYNCQQIGLLDSGNAYTLPAMSVTTFVFENLDYYGGRPGAVVWGMNDLPEDLVSAGWATAEFGSNGDYNPENVTVTKASGMGFDGGDALAITQVQAGNWADIYRLRPAEKDALYANDWTGREILWFWADATQAQNDLTVELLLDSVSPMVGYDCYTLDDSGKVIRTDSLVRAYDGDISYGVIPVSAGFRGWIGVPLAAYGNVSGASSMRVYLRKTQAGDVLYLDEFCISKADAVPALPQEPALPAEGLTKLFDANENIGQRYAYANSNSRQAWVFGVEGTGGGSILWESQSYAAVQWLPVPETDISGSIKLYFYVDNQSGYAVDKLGVGIKDANGAVYQPGLSVIATKNGYTLDYSAVAYGYKADGASKWTTGKLDSWGWMRSIPQDFSGWMYINITGQDSYETVCHSAADPVTPDLSQITGICIKAGEDKPYSVLFDSFYAGSSAPVENEISQWNLALGEDIGANFYMNILEQDVANAVVKLTVAGKTTAVNASDVTPDADGYYVFSADVAAAQMTDTITVELVVNGETVDSGEYTVRQYADVILAGDYDDVTKNLVKAMLNYGGKAQTYFGYNTDAPAGDGITVTETDIPADVEAMSVSGKADGVSYYGATLVFQSKTAVRFYFTGDITGCTFKAEEETLTPVRKDNMWYIEIAQINPQDLDKAITLSVNGTLTVTYSPMHYMVRMYNGNGSDTLKTLLKAMYIYHLAAKAYL